MVIYCLLGLSSRYFRADLVQDPRRWDTPLHCEHKKMFTTIQISNSFLKTRSPISDLDLIKKRLKWLFACLMSAFPLRLKWNENNRCKLIGENFLWATHSIIQFTTIPIIAGGALQPFNIGKNTKSHRWRCMYSKKLFNRHISSFRNSTFSMCGNSKSHLIFRWRSCVAHRAAWRWYLSEREEQVLVIMMRVMVTHTWPICRLSSAVFASRIGLSNPHRPILEMMKALH